MPYIHVLLTFATFAVIPVVSVLLYLYILIKNTDDLWGSCYGTWMLTYSVSCACLAPMDVLVIYPTFESMRD